MGHATVAFTDFGGFNRTRFPKASEFQDQGQSLGSQTRSDYFFEPTFGRSSVMQRVLEQASCAAPTDSAVLLRSEPKTVEDIPLVNLGRALSLLAVEPTAERRYDASEIQFLSQVACQIAIAIDKARACDDLSELRNNLADEEINLEEEIRSEMGFEQIIGSSPALKQVLQLVETVAPSDSTVLLLGETGTGKELIARAIHERSRRKNRTFVKLNCAAIPTGLLESELFGHEKGAFTGAISQKVGRFELAHQGTLLLDEVGDIPPELQPKLLRVLQEQEFERLGGTKTIKVDVRLVAATHRDLARLVGDGRFREDLYYRLNVFPLVLPPLRERRADVPLLVSYFVQKFARRMGRRIEAIPSAVMEALVRYPWPGNIRELQNVIERAVILSPGPSLQVPLGDLQPAPAQAQVPAAAPGTLADAERDHILGVLRETGWVLGGPNGAAARLGMKRTTLQSKIKKLGISRPR